MTFEELKAKAKVLPNLPGVYLMKNDREEIIYVGKAKDLKKRVSSYFDGRNKWIKVEAMVENISFFDFILTNTEADAFALECNLIKKHMPKYNILLKDDKAFPYLSVNKKDKFPRFQITRNVKADGKTYFGPYVTHVSVSKVLKLINSAFKLATCKLGFKKIAKRTCIEGDMNRCLAPCVEKVSQEEYRQKVEEACDFLSGKTGNIKRILKQQMNKASEALDFENAIFFREQLELVKNMETRVVTNLPIASDIDVFVLVSEEKKSQGQVLIAEHLIVRAGKTVGQEVFLLEEKSGTEEEKLASVVGQSYANASMVPKEIVVSHEIVPLLSEFFQKTHQISPKISCPKKGVKNKLLQYALTHAKEYASRNAQNLITHQRNTTGAMEDLMEILELNNKPYRIEGYDISNTFGTSSVASMVVFEGGEPAKKEYRRFKIKTVEGANDFASLHEVIKRRFAKDESFGRRPNLVLIDGGLGQLHAAHNALQESGVEIPIISLAEKEEIIFTPNKTEPIALNKREPALKLLQRIRDESHRFALEYHTKLRTKKMLGKK